MKKLQLNDEERRKMRWRSVFGWGMLFRQAKEFSFFQYFDRRLSQKTKTKTKPHTTIIISYTKRFACSWSGVCAVFNQASVVIWRCCELLTVCWVGWLGAVSLAQPFLFWQRAGIVFSVKSSPTFRTSPQTSKLSKYSPQKAPLRHQEWWGGKKCHLRLKYRCTSRAEKIPPVMLTNGKHFSYARFSSHLHGFVLFGNEAA